MTVQRETGYMIHVKCESVESCAYGIPLIYGDGLGLWHLELVDLPHRLAGAWLLQAFQSWSYFVMSELRSSVFEGLALGAHVGLAAAWRVRSTAARAEGARTLDWFHSEALRKGETVPNSKWQGLPLQRDAC